MTEILENLPPAVMLVLALLLVVWLVLLLLVPFMIESIRGWSRRSCLELEQQNKKLDQLILLLSERADAEAPDAPEAPPLRAIERTSARDPAERARKEPTISG